MYHDVRVRKRADRLGLYVKIELNLMLGVEVYGMRVLYLMYVYVRESRSRVCMCYVQLLFSYIMLCDGSVSRAAAS